MALVPLVPGPLQTYPNKMCTVDTKGSLASTAYVRRG